MVRGDGSALPLIGRHIVIANWRDSRHPQAGGAEMYCEETAREFRDLGARVTLVTSRSPGTPAEEQTDYGTVVRRGGTFGTYPRVLLWLARHRSSIDAVVDSENGIPYFTPLALRRRTPVVLLIHHVHQQQFEQYYPPAVAMVGKLLEKYGARWVYGRRPVCVVSPSTRAEVRRQLAFRGPVFIAPNGLGPSQPHPVVARSAIPRLVCVGRLVKHKRVELLLGAVPALLARWPELEIHVIGDGNQRAHLEREAARLGIDQHVVFHGRLDSRRRDDLVASAWVTVNPSAGEGWGLSVIEAAAQGVPAVAFQVPGLQDSVRHGTTGWLIEEPEELAGAIDQALETLEDPERAATFARRCREWAGTFTWHSTARRILAVLVSEADRLQGGLDERRRSSDATTVVELPRSIVTDEVLSRLRRSDQIRVTDDRIDLLLGGADEVDAGKALHRLGLPASMASRARVARHYDLLGWMSRPDQLLGPGERSSHLVEMEDASGQVILLRPRRGGDEGVDGRHDVHRGS